MDYLESEGRDPLADDIDPSDALPEEDEDALDLEDFDPPEDLDAVEDIDDADLT